MIFSLSAWSKTFKSELWWWSRQNWNSILNLHFGKLQVYKNLFLFSCSFFDIHIEPKQYSGWFRGTSGDGIKFSRSFLDNNRGNSATCWILNNGIHWSFNRHRQNCYGIYRLSFWKKDVFFFCFSKSFNEIGCPDDQNSNFSGISTY